MCVGDETRRKQAFDSQIYGMSFVADLQAKKEHGWYCCTQDKTYFAFGRISVAFEELFRRGFGDQIRNE